MLTILEDAKKSHIYKLEDIADELGISKYVVRKYIREVVPEEVVDSVGQGRATRYGESTRNSIKFILMLKNQAVLSLTQITEVMKELGQDGINRVATGEEPLEISLATIGEDGEVKFPEGYKEKHTVLLEGNSAKTISKTDETEIVYPMREEVIWSPEDLDWNTYPVADRVHVRYKGVLNEDQLDELKIVSRILKSIIER